MNQSAQAPPVRSRSRAVVTGIVQLVSAVVAALAASWLWQVANNQESRLGAGFWGFVAVTSFCSVIGVLNLLFPLIRCSVRALRPERYRFGHPLRSISGNWEVIRELFGLGLAFLAPVVPLAFMTLRMYQAEFDLTLLGVGATIVCALLSGILLSITTSQLYTMFVGGEAIVEIEREPLEAGDNTRLFVSYEPGRLVPQRISVRVVCTKTRNRQLLPNRKRQWGSRRPTKIELYAAVLHAQEISANVHWPWEYVGILALPHGAQASDTDSPSSSIDWFIEVQLRFPRAPDVQLVYPLRVV